MRSVRSRGPREPIGCARVVSLLGSYSCLMVHRELPTADSAVSVSCVGLPRHSVKTSKPAHSVEFPQSRVDYRRHKTRSDVRGVCAAPSTATRLSVAELEDETLLAPLRSAPALRSFISHRSFARFLCVCACAETPPVRAANAD